MATKKKGLTAAQKRDLTELLASYEQVLKLNPSQFDNDNDLHADNWVPVVQYGGYQLMKFLGEYPLLHELMKRVRKHNTTGPNALRKANWICEVDGISRFGGSRARSIKAIMSDKSLTAAQRSAELSARNK